MKKNLWFVVCLCVFMHSTLFAQEVTVDGNKFQVNGDDIFFNAISGPWQWRADCDINFMRRNFDWSYWNQEFQRYADNNINLVRIWLHGSGNFSPAINTNAFIDAYGSGDQFWQDMDALVALAATYEVYIMPTFWSFDMVKEGMSTYYQHYRTLIQDDNRMGSYLDNFLIPFLNRYEDNPWIMGYDLVNEPEHMWRDADCGHLNQYWVMRFFARCAAAVNQYSSKPVTIGSMWIVYNSPNFGSPDGDPQAGWNRYTDASMRSYFDSPDAYLDFYSPHWYQWQNTSGPYERTVQQWLGSNDKPVIIGETFGGDLPEVFGSLTNYYIQSYLNGYDGVIGWKNACENDGYGTWNGISPATNAFYNAYPNLVYPWRNSNENVAYGKPAFASSTESAGHAPSFAFDGNGETRWASAYADPQWIYVDLQQQYQINRIRLDWESAYARQFQIQVSSDNQTWSTVYSNYSHLGGETDVTVDVAARYVKMYGWERATQWGYSLYEFEVYGNPLSGAPQFVAVGQEMIKSKVLCLVPNPANFEVQLSGFGEAADVKVFDVSGVVVAEFKAQSGSTVLDVSTWPAGMYFVQTGGVVKKLMVQN